METPSFLTTWNLYVIWAALVSVAIGGLIFLYYEYRVLQIKGYKEKYDYVNEHEIRYFWFAVVALVIAFAFYANSLGTDIIIARGIRWFYVRLFITASFLVVSYFIFYSLVQIYYPRYVEKRLLKLRNTPRISPAGNPMRKLHEHEEDAHLDASQIAEEANVHSVDYDVWIDDKTGFKNVEKYDSHMHAVECPNCGYFTMKIASEEIEKKPTATEDGLLIKHYQCGYCKHREANEVVLAKLSSNV
ncbi:MAG: hypothetical protein AABY93_13660 [Bacteroidota bacterium]